MNLGKDSFLVPTTFWAVVAVSEVQYDCLIAAATRLGAAALLVMMRGRTMTELLFRQN
jgi:hypothetical protein